MKAPVTIVSCLYGETHDRFVGDWLDSVRSLETKPAEVIVAADHINQRLVYPEIYAFATDYCDWRYPQAFYLNQAILAANTEWVWILDIDDAALPDALDGIDAVDADVWQMGYIRSSDAETHIPPAKPDPKRNLFTAGSAIRRDAFEEVGGFRDVAFQDWDLWCRMLLLERRFESSGRAHYLYRIHEHSRTNVELGEKNRAAHIEEMHVA